MISHLLAIFLWKRMETHWGTEASEEETEPPQCGQNSNSDDIAWKFPATGASQWRVEDGAIPPRGAACRLRGLSSVLPGKPVEEALSEPGESSPLWPASPWPLVHVAHFAEVKKPRLRECARRCARHCHCACAASARGLGSARLGRLAGVPWLRKSPFRQGMWKYRGVFSLPVAPETPLKIASGLGKGPRHSRVGWATNGARWRACPSRASAPGGGVASSGLLSPERRPPSTQPHPRTSQASGNTALSLLPLIWWMQSIIGLQVVKLARMGGKAAAPPWGSQRRKSPSWGNT